VIQSIAHFLVHYFDFGGKRLILGMADFSCPPPPPPAARWQQSKAGALQHHGIKSAFYKPALDGSKLAKKRESPGGRESLQDRLVEALESSRCQKVISGVQLTFFQATILGTSKDIFSSF
jgi:hypothetical protein